MSGINKETISKWVRKKNLDKNKLEIKYVQGRTGKEVRIFKPSLETYLETLGEEARIEDGTKGSNTKAGTSPKSHCKMDGIKYSKDHGTVIDDTMVRYVDSLEKQVDWLQRQLETVNEQRGRDQMLMLNLQNDNKKLLEKTEEAPEVVEQKDEKKKGWWPFSN